MQNESTGGGKRSNNEERHRKSNRQGKAAINAGKGKHFASVGRAAAWTVLSREPQGRLVCAEEKRAVPGARGTREEGRKFRETGDREKTAEKWGAPSFGRYIETSKAECHKKWQLRHHGKKTKAAATSRSRAKGKKWSAEMRALLKGVARTRVERERKGRGGGHQSRRLRCSEGRWHAPQTCVGGWGDGYEAQRVRSEAVRRRAVARGVR